MQIKALETFLCVAETGGFHAAARRMNVTQTAVSARIRAVEQAVGQALFRRGAGGTALTDFGHQFRPYAQQMVSLWSFASRDLPDQSANRASIRLGAQLSIWDPLLVDLAISLEENFGKLLLTLNYDHNLDMAEAVAANILDAALTQERSHKSNVTFEELPPERLVLVEAQGTGSSRETVFVNLELGERYQDHVRAVAQAASAQTLFLSNCMMGLRYVLQRGGRGYFPTYAVAQHLHAGELIYVPDSQDLTLPVYLATRDDSANHPQFTELRTCLRKLRTHSRQPPGQIG